MRLTDPAWLRHPLANPLSAGSVGAGTVNVQVSRPSHALRLYGAPEARRSTVVLWLKKV